MIDEESVYTHIPPFLEPRFHVANNRRDATVHIVLYDNTIVAIPSGESTDNLERIELLCNHFTHHRNLYIRLFQQLVNSTLPTQQSVFDFGNLSWCNHFRTVAIRNRTARTARHLSVRTPYNMFREWVRFRNSQESTVMHVAHRQDRLLSPHRSQLYGHMDFATDDNSRPVACAYAAQRA